MVFLPLKDDNSLKFIWFQFTTALLIAANIAVFVYQVSLGERQMALIEAAGVTPTLVFDGVNLPAWLGSLPMEVTLITYMFLHGDIMHLAGNMLFLWVFGDNIEDAMGSIAFLFFYLISGVAAGLAHIVMNVDSGAPLIGASGAVAGVVAAYVLLYPRVWMWTLAFMRIPVKLPAFVVIGAWLAFQIVYVIMPMEDGSGTAWWAHIGGFVAGLVLVPIFKRRDQPLFGGAPHR